MLKLCSKNLYRPVQNSMEPHQTRRVSPCKQRKQKACGNLAADSKSADRKVVGVRPPLPAPFITSNKSHILNDLQRFGCVDGATSQLKSVIFRYKNRYSAHPLCPERFRRNHYLSSMDRLRLVPHNCARLRSDQRTNCPPHPLQLRNAAPDHEHRGDAGQNGEKSHQGHPPKRRQARPQSTRRRI